MAETYAADTVYGFNYDGSWGASGLDVWQHHDHGRMSVEVARGKRYFPEWNTARWWLSHEAFQLDPERFLANFDAGLALFDAHGIRVMPVLFNRWRDPTCDFGGVPLDHILPWASAWTRADDLFADAPGEGRTLAPVEEFFRRYVDDVVGSHADDDRIYAWDLCNEPLMGRYVEDPESPLRKAELTWLRWVADRTRGTGARQPLTVGNYASLTAVRLTEPFTDIISFHPYYMWSGDNPLSHMTTKEGFEHFVDAVTEFARDAGKGLIASETVWGARNHDIHVEVTKYTLGALADRGIGFTVHALHHSLIADLHRDAYGPVGRAEWMHFIEADGTLRPGHEVFNDFAPSRREAARR
jgi:Cellulase (glycosyl hydrolase family 5)